MILEEYINSKLILIYFIVSVSVFQSGVDFQMSLFIYYPPKYQCVPPNQTNVQITSDNCFYFSGNSNSVKQPCTNWKFDKTQIKSTIVTEMKLICEKQYLQLILIPIRNLSGIFAVLLGILSDKKGRKNMFIICCAMDALTWILIGIVPQIYSLHAFLRFIKLFGIGSSIIGFVLVSELTPQKYRNFIVINYWSIFSIGMAFSPFYVKNISHWQWSWLISAWPMCFYCLAPFVLLESPKWLLVNSRRDEAVENLKKLDQYSSENKFPKIDDENLENIVETEIFCQSFILIKRFAVLLLTSLSFYLVYQGTSTNLEFAISDIYINAMIMGLIEIPAGPLGYLSNKYIGSVTSVVLWTFVGMFTYVMIPDHWEPMLALTKLGQTSHVVLASLAKFFLVLAWNVTGVFYVDLFPTNNRNFVTNVGEMCGFIGAAIGGFLGYYFKSNGFTVANFIYGIFLIISMLLFGFIIPSVNKIVLPNTVKEAEQIDKSFSCCYSDSDNEINENK